MNNQYYKELSKFKTLTNDEIIEIYQRVENGDEKAINEMIQANLKLAVYIAKQYHQTIQSDNIIELDDLISEANVGLILAANKFKLKYGVKFSAYAIHWIKKIIQQSIQKNENNIRLPVNITESNNKIRLAIKELFQKNEADVTQNDIENLDLFSKNEIEMYFTNRNLIQIETQYNVEDFDSDKSNFDDDIERNRKINHALKHLTPKERMIIKMIYGIDQDEVEPADRCIQLKVSRARASQLKLSALSKLKKILDNVEI